MTIGEFAVVGAASVVTKSIPPRCVAVGNPAKVIRVLDDEEWVPGKYESTAMNLEEALEMGKEC